MAFKEVDIHTLQFNPFDKISKQWMLITAGEQEKSNTMTASWGGVGFMWGKPVATAYIRLQRYTKEFVDTNDRFTLPCCVEVEGGKAVTVSEAEMIFVCRKLYVQEMLPECFVDEKSKETWYPQKDYHVMYMAEIEKVLVRE